MNRTKAVRVAGLGGLLLGAWYVLFSGPLQVCVTRENIARVAKGMKESEVTELLGPPSSAAWEGCVCASQASESDWHWHRAASVKEWIGTDCCVVISFDEKALVVGKSEGSPWPVDRSTFGHIRRWVNRWRP